MTACGGNDQTASSITQNSFAAATISNTTAVFTGVRNNYTIVKAASGYTVIDNVGTDGTSNLGPEIRTFQFTDIKVDPGIGAKSLTLPAADLKLLTELYIAFFNRVPEAEGLSYWIDQFKAGQSVNQIADIFFSAAIQYTALTGYSASMSDADFVRVIYRNVLGRSGATAPPDEDVQFWVGELSSGRQSKGTLVRSMLDSAHTFVGHPTWGFVPSLLDNKYTVGHYFAVQQGISYNTPELSIQRTMDIAAAVTPTDTVAAINRIPVSPSTQPVDPNTPAAYPARALNARFNAPRALTVDTNGKLYIADSGNDTVRKINNITGAVTTFAGTPGQFGQPGAPAVDGVGAAARFNVLTGITLDAGGNLYLTDTFLDTGRIRKITPDATVSTPVESVYAFGIAADATGTLYFTNNFSGLVERFSPQGVRSTVVAIREPRGLTLDTAGNLYVSNTGSDFGPLGQSAFSCTVDRIAPAGAVTTLAGAIATQPVENTCGYADGEGAAAKIGRNAFGVAVDATGNVFVADTSNHVIRKVTPAGVVTTVAGTAAAPGSADGTGADARFNGPRGITVDSAGNLYVADTNNHTIRRITAAGVVTTIAGRAGEAGTADVTP
ncbi:DUF4214 domain-containing protein [Noviherbaspirillum saxi]|uniref:DUF4214 domain-containing protein n=1 Tax=Noviherbaspirillum saxi TaxID=2320863 RepID=UPI0013149FCC|nr:DUF4214 domain-containing protein [Noviherbaspirillum saxi]